MSRIKIHSRRIPGSRSTNSRFVLALFWISLLFQLTVLKNIWHIEGLARFMNSVALLAVCLYAVHSISSYRFRKNVWFFYIMPGFLVFAGMFLNFTLNTITNLNVINYFGGLFSWATYLAMPALLKKNACDSATLWRYFYYFMLAAVFLGLSEYFLVFSGKFSMWMISTSGGEFLAGRFSILLALKDGSAYTRFHGCFGEPGTLAMFLVPVMAYAYFHKKYIGLSLFILALYLTSSLGGIIAAVMIIPLVVFTSINKKKVSRVVSIIVAILVSSVFVLGSIDYISRSFEHKLRGRTITSRIENVMNTITNLPSMIVNNPIGFELAEGSASASQNPQYYGSNFTPGHILQMGGISAFLGYLLILLVSLVAAFLRIIRKNLSLEEKVAFTSLIVLFPFIVQRGSLWESAIFAFLFAPSIINFLQLRGRVSSYSGSDTRGK